MSKNIMPSISRKLSESLPKWLHNTYSKGEYYIPEAKMYNKCDK